VRALRFRVSNGVGRPLLAPPLSITGEYGAIVFESEDRSQAGAGKRVGHHREGIPQDEERIVAERRRQVIAASQSLASSPVMKVARGVATAAAVPIVAGKMALGAVKNLFRKFTQ
jgi:hypothetical protein